MSDGLFLTVEGIDGSGTTTVVETADDQFDNVLATQEPAEQYWTGEATRRAINEDETHPMTDFHFFLGDRAYHLKHTVKPGLKAGKAVVSDRYFHSTFAYQQENLEGVVEDPFNYIYNSMREWVREPELTILLDVPAEVAAERTSDGDKYEASEFQKKVRQNYLDLAEDDEQIIVVDATQPKEKVVNESLAIIKEAMNLQGTSSHNYEEW